MQICIVLLPMLRSENTPEPLPCLIPVLQCHSALSLGVIYLLRTLKQRG